MNKVLVDARKAKGLSQRTLAKQVGLSLLGYQRYEYEGTIPRADRAKAIADALGLYDYKSYCKLWGLA